MREGDMRMSEETIKGGKQKIIWRFKEGRNGQKKHSR